MTRPKAGLEEIRKFLTKFRVDVDSIDFKSEPARCLYRRFHALLLWEIVVDHEDEPASVRLYMQECLADLASAYLVNFLSGYKISRLALRGAVENCVRVATASAGQDVSQITTVYELFEECRKSWATSPKRLESINNIHSIYGVLCQTVHSTSIGYMSLKVPFEQILSHDKKEYLSNCAVLDTSLKLVGEILFLEFSSKLGRIDFKNADYIRDSVEADVKRRTFE